MDKGTSRWIAIVAMVVVTFGSIIFGITGTAAASQADRLERVLEAYNGEIDSLGREVSTIHAKLEMLMQSHTRLTVGVNELVKEMRK